jgi:hypothetical protein
VVIVVATDVRDRLFLLEQLRDRLPAVMLVDLESDDLFSHPDFLHASRGAIALASANMVHWTTGGKTGPIVEVPMLAFMVVNAERPTAFRERIRLDCMCPEHRGPLPQQE